MQKTWCTLQATGSFGMDTAAYVSIVFTSALRINTAVDVTIVTFLFFLVLD